MGARRFSGRPVSADLQGRIEQVVEDMIAGRVPVPHIAVTWNSRIVYCAARVSTGLNRRGERLAPPKVELSSKAWPLLTREEQEQCLIHESGHVAASLLGFVNEHHGWNWKKLMRDYGAPADRCMPEAAAIRVLQAFPRKRRVQRVTNQWRVVTTPFDDFFGGRLTSIKHK